MNVRRFLTATLLAIALAGSFVHASEKPNPVSPPGPGEPTRADVRRLTERFRDVNVALAEGYIRDPFDMCETAEMMPRTRRWLPAPLVSAWSSSPLWL